MTASEYAKQLGAVMRRQGDKHTATISSVGDMSRFRSVLIRNGIQFRDTFANAGKAIKFIFTDAPIAEVR